MAGPTRNRFGTHEAAGRFNPLGPLESAVALRLPTQSKMDGFAVFAIESANSVLGYY